MNLSDLLLLAALGAGGFYLYKRCSRPGARCLPSTWREDLDFRRASRSPLELREPEPEHEAARSGARIVRPYRTVVARPAATPTPTPARATPAAAAATSPARAQLIRSGYITPEAGS